MMNLEIPSEILDLIPQDKANLSLDKFLLEALKLGLNTINSVSKIENEMKDEMQHKSNDENSNIKNEKINLNELTREEQLLYLLEESLKKEANIEANIDETILITSSHPLMNQYLCEILKVPTDPNNYYHLDNIYDQKSDDKFNKIRKQKELISLAYFRKLISSYYSSDYSIDTLRVMLRKYDKDNNILELITRIKQMAINIIE